MHTLDDLDAASLRSDVPDFRPGDTLKVHVRVVEGNRERIQVFQEPELQKRDVKKQLLVTAAAPLVVVFGVCMGLALLEYRLRRVRTAGEEGTAPISSAGP